jgi:hypothetical protein
MTNFVGILAEVSLADVSEFNEVAGAPDSARWLLAIPVVVLALAYGIYRLCNQMPATAHTPSGLLTELCRAHSLTGSTGNLLHKISRAAELSQPASLLMSAKGFDEAVSAASRRIRFGKSEKKAIATVRRSVFS